LSRDEMTRDEKSPNRNNFGIFLLPPRQFCGPPTTKAGQRACLKSSLPSIWLRYYAVINLTFRRVIVMWPNCTTEYCHIEKLSYGLNTKAIHGAAVFCKDWSTFFLDKKTWWASVSKYLLPSDRLLHKWIM